MSASFTSAEKKTKRDILNVWRPWSYDAGYWVDPGIVNDNFKLIDLDRVDRSNIPLELLRNHVYDEDSLDFDEIIFDDDIWMYGWRPGVKVGHYSIKNSASKLLSSERLTLQVKDDTDAYGRTVLALPYMAAPELGVFAETLYREVSTLEARQDVAFTKVTSFTGLALNGVEYDTDDDPSAVDDTKNEFITIDPVRYDFSSELSSPEVVGGNLYVFTLSAPPTMAHPPVFTRRDVFLTEKSLKDFNAARITGTLDHGDYTVGYIEYGLNHTVMVRLDDAEVSYGAVSYIAVEEGQIVFNKNVCAPRAQALNAAGLRGITLQYFPVVDKSYVDPDTEALQLDTDSLTLTVDGTPWTRTHDLTGEAAAAEVFELNPTTGVITFGAEGNGGIGGARPHGLVNIDYSSAPFVTVETATTRGVFHDMTCDIDPKRDASPSSFLCLDTRSLIAERIILTTDSEFEVLADGSRLHGPLSAVVVDREDIAWIRARVIAAGAQDVGVPNVAVEFFADNTVTNFMQQIAVTDAEGYARTQIYGAGQFRSYILSVEKYESMSVLEAHVQPDPDDMTPYTPPYGPHFLDARTLIVPEVVDPAATDLYILISSIPAAGVDAFDYDGVPADVDDIILPYDGMTREDGIAKVWSIHDGSSQQVVHPISISDGPAAGTSAIAFAIDIPVGRLITSYKLVVDRRSVIKARLVERPDVVSNGLAFEYALDSSFVGQWRLPYMPPPDDDELSVEPVSALDIDSGRIGSGTFISPNSITVEGVRPLGGGADLLSVTPGDAIEIYGSQFPTTEELKLSVFIMKIDGESIVAVRDITASTIIGIGGVIEIPALPVPPVDEYDVEYHLAVGGYDPFSTEDAPTSIAITFTE